MMSMSLEVPELEKLHIAGSGSGAGRGKAGVPNQAITKPITVNSDTGEVIVKKSTGKQRVRKGQDVEQYREQLRHFYEVEKGPTVTPEGWMTPQGFDEMINTLDLENKHNRLVIMGFIHRWYYNREYITCLKHCKIIQEKYNSLKVIKVMKKEFDELQYIANKCEQFI